MKHLVIIGGGGWVKDIYHSAKHSIGYGTEYDIKGFIDDTLNSLMVVRGIASLRYNKEL